MLTDDAKYRVLSGRDARFDGVFFAAITSTGIYCRPSCPAITPKRQNVRFYRTAAEAQSAGFRACRRCRPDTTPGSPEWNIRADLIGRAMRLISDGVVDRDGVSGLASMLGYSTRHLNRALRDELGAGPLRLARSQRAHTARVLLETTEMPVTDIAFASGFASVRQFNDTIREVYAFAPREIRQRAAGAQRSSGEIALRLAFRKPADLSGALEFLAERAIPGVEDVTDGTYRRSVALPHGDAIVALTPHRDWVDARLKLADLRDLTTAVARCRRLLDLDADPEAIDAALGADPTLGPWVRRSPGRRVPGAANADELAFRAVLGQQVSVTSARGVAARLVQMYGRPLESPDGAITHLFPSPADLASADPETFPMPRTRQRTVHDLATALASESIRLDAGADRDDAEKQLQKITGIGAWTTAYIRMRALNDPDVFLPTDLIVRRMVDPTQSQLWRPWRSYALMHIWAASSSPHRARNNHDERSTT